MHSSKLDSETTLVCHSFLRMATSTKNYSTIWQQPLIRNEHLIIVQLQSNHFCFPWQMKSYIIFLATNNIQKKLLITCSDIPKKFKYSSSGNIALFSHWLSKNLGILKNFISDTQKTAKCRVSSSNLLIFFHWFSLILFWRSQVQKK